MFKIIILLLSLISFATSTSPYVSTSPHTIRPRRVSRVGVTPTNSWYQNWLIGAGENPIQSYPYLVKASTKGFTICYSSQMISQMNYVSEVFIDNWSLFARESPAIQPIISPATVNADFFDLAASVLFDLAFDVTIVRGSASILANFRARTPVLRTIHAITGVSELNDTRSLKVSMNNGQTWLIQSQTRISWRLASSEISAQSAYTGWLKISIVTSANVENALQTNIDSLIRNGKVSYVVNRTTDTVAVQVEYNSQGLFYQLAHVATMSGVSLVANAATKGIKGTYQMAIGRSYQYILPVHKSSNSSRAVDTQEKRDRLREAVKNDVDSLRINNRDPYFGGKELAKTANLIEIAHLAGDLVSKEKAKTILINILDGFWFNSSLSAFVYEPTWGGIVSRSSVGSSQAEFGHYYYNDHHFHYGYFINAAATLAKHYPSEYNSRSEYFRPLLADYAGTCDYARQLPCRPRNKDAFLGHSYAAGLFEFADSRNQESTSEACNAYWAVRELGKALGNRTLEDLGDYLLSSEIHATKTYWQIKQPSSIYPTPFALNGVVGILWETKVDYATWFGANVEYIYGIQMLPFNDITEQYLDRAWLRGTRSKWSQAFASTTLEESWRGFLLLADSLVDPNQQGLAQSIHSLRAYDNGNSRTNTLYFYYLVGGSPISTTIVSSTTNDPATTSRRVLTTTSTNARSNTTRTSCPGNGCTTRLTDNGKTDSRCGPGLLGCHTTQGSLIGCYSQSTYTCFIGGNLCLKPLLACLNPAVAPTPGAACYDSSIYSCADGQLFFLGK